MSEQIAIPEHRMTVEEFLVWARDQPKGKYELYDGRVVVDMAPEVARHARAKAEAYIALRAAMKTAGVPCEAFIDGLGIRTDSGKLYIPDVVVNCGQPVDPAAQTVSEPVIVLEVVSPGTRRIDTGSKLADYFRTASLHHYLLVMADQRVVVHHARAGDAIATRILHAGRLVLDPPGIAIEVEDLFGPA